MKIIYDEDCPFCSNYVKFLRFKETVGEIELVNARTDISIQRYLKERSIDINQGIVLMDGDELYFAEDCMHRLALMSTPSNLFNYINKMIFKNKTLSKILYPWLKMGRNFTLFILRKTKI